MKFLLLSVVLCLSVSCGKKSSKSNSQVSQIFVKGDPFTMVSGTQKNQTSFITTTNASRFNNYVLSGISIFAEKESMPETTTSTIEEGNEAGTSDETIEAKTLFNLKQITSQEYSLQDAKGEIKFDFSLTGSLLELTSISFGSVKIGAKVEHYSITADGSKFSFLVRIETASEGNVLLTATFYRDSEAVTIKKVSKDYHYIYGPGVVVPWKLDESRKINIKVCPSVTDHLDFSMVKDALKTWESPFTFSQQKLTIDVVKASSCKPFSDVEEHSIHYVDSYLTMANKERFNAGFTIPHGDMAQGNIFDADIILLGAEIAKDSTFDTRDYKRTISHEMGHFIGLDHQFDGTTSIMSYENQFSLGTYDHEAIKNLYSDG